MSVSLVTIAAGSKYAAYVPTWWRAVQAMRPMPDEIVIVVDAEDTANVADVVEGENIHLVHAEEPFGYHYFNLGFRAATSEWISYCGIDDQMLPNAYADIPTATQIQADIIVGTILMSNGYVWRGSWNPYGLRQNNTLPAHSPFRKALYEKVGGFPDIRWSDWGFWLKCVREDPVIYLGTQPLAIFDVGEDRETMSGSSLDANVRQAADAELHAYRESLWQSV